ncbi:SigE family RNA polymerase sigma factor [soil metagenome]
MVVRLHNRLFFRTAWGIVRDVDVAEDMVQDALVKLVDNPGQIRDREMIRAWLVTAIINGSKEHLRRKKSESAAMIKRGANEVESAEAIDFLQHDKLMKKVGELESGIREVVVLRKMQGLSGREVKEILKLSLPEVSRRLKGGLERLRRAMTDGTMHDADFRGSSTDDGTA